MTPSLVSGYGLPMDRDKKTQCYISARRLRFQKLRKRRSEGKGEETGSETGGGGEREGK